MRLLILANNDVGLYQFRRELIAALLENGHEVFISLPKGELVEPLCELGCHFIDTPIDRRGINPFADLALMRRYRRLMARIKPEQVITYTIKPNIYGGMLCRMRGLDYAVNITGLGTAFQGSGALRRLVTMMYKLALKKARVVFFENAENRRVLLEEGIVKESQCCLLNGAGVNTEHYAYAPYPAEELPVRFLFIGRIMREKGIDELFAAMKRLREDGLNCTLELLGGCEEDYTERISAYTAEGFLRYHGYQRDVRPFIADAHCFVLPSYHEGMANTNLEAASMGRPLITSNIHGCKEAVLEGESGFLCEAGNSDSLYECMKRFCMLSRDEREQMGMRGRQHMLSVFEKNKVVAETVKELGDG